MKPISKIKVGWKIIRKLVLHPKSIFEIFRDESEYEKYLVKKYGITKLPTIALTKFLPDHAGQIHHICYLDGSSMVTDILLLRSLALRYANCEYLEIGLWRGESIINVVDNAKRCTSITLSPDDIISMGYSKKYAELHGCLLDSSREKIDIIYANSKYFDFSTLNKKFDLIFIDGDHSYDGVKSDTTNVIRLLRDESSIIVWHDYAYNPEKPRHSVLAAILDGLPKAMHAQLFHVSNTMCALYINQKFKSQLLSSPVAPDKLFDVSINIHPYEVKLSSD